MQRLALERLIYLFPCNLVIIFKDLVLYFAPKPLERPPVENNTAYARYINPIMGTGISRTFLQLSVTSQLMPDSW
ncbi:uncharacterized protein ANIA_11386 [Aspergillus nidulans FGSC A4]|uniref:Uncharacterized protein n=1 Tax=Emericella nidulans (strain FGSC A4 / ATCC 38163 / CBS 112.46 / NRRL 194 / M139) TaxID=227321 RepID=C8VHX2_EMENI|nr:hypothetical protein [Aspergillus nidulans FGSC A4]CBF82949.1 TPA: hypothetical protein ANIA_11386 [Aspergillus nidulans FGSC A4]